MHLQNHNQFLREPVIYKRNNGNKFQTTFVTNLNMILVILYFGDIALLVNHLNLQEHTTAPSVIHVS